MLKRWALSMRQQLRPGRIRLDEPDGPLVEGSCEIMLVAANAKW
jgi:hypothetical protein